MINMYIQSFCTVGKTDWNGLDIISSQNHAQVFYILFILVTVLKKQTFSFGFY